jgi:hypothetical protein
MVPHQRLPWQQQQQDVASMAEIYAFEDSLSQWWTDLVVRSGSTTTMQQNT